MAAKAKAPSRAAAPAVAKKPQVGSSTTQSLTMDERLHRIDALRKRIDGYIEYICRIVDQTGTSGEVKERAVTVFYEQLLIVEKELGHIHDELRLE